MVGDENRVNTVAAMAQALDRFPDMIGVFAEALGLVRKIGNNKDDAAFNGITFGFAVGKFRKKRAGSLSESDGAGWIFQFC